MKPQSPCYKCEDRRVGCHAECERYSAYRAKLEAWREVVMAEQMKEAIADSVMITTAKKMKKYREKGGNKP